MRHADPSGIEAQSPGEFPCNLFALAPEGFVEMRREKAVDLQSPHVTFEEWLDLLAHVVGTGPAHDGAGHRLGDGAW